jgi:hypothetical protein
MAPIREFAEHPSPETCLMWSDFTGAPAWHRLPASRWKYTYYTGICDQVIR